MSTYYGIKCKTCEHEPIPCTADTFEKNGHQICDELIAKSKDITDIIEKVVGLDNPSRFFCLDVTSDNIPSDTLDFMYKHKGHTFVVYDEYGREVASELL